MHGGPELTIVVLALVALLLGAVMRGVGRRFAVPHTVAMLLLGIVLGELARRYGADHVPILTELAEAREGISPALLLFVFLPALIFESAFGLDVHAFSKDAGSIIILALPALLVTAGLAGLVAWPIAETAGLGWGLGGALVFGALAGATDPVAVVAVLREVGAPRRLAVLIEGESLLNDGTAIVVFTTIVAVFAGGDVVLDPVHVGVDFLRTVIGGIAFGYGLAWTCGRWIGRTFNDPMVEITLTVALAYAAMIVAEAGFHVSGVIAIVVAGLYLAGPARTRVSPEVAHFLHRFWELAAYVANTLIFFLVGLVTAGILEKRHFAAIAVGVALWLALIVIRFAVTFMFMPLMNRLAQPVSVREALVLSWGGLRGAVSLALALGLATSPDIDRAFGEQVLVVTATVALLTILVNGTTTGALLRRLGFTDVAPEDEAADLDAECEALREVERRLAEASHERDFATVPLEERRAEVEARRAALATMREVVADSVGTGDEQLRGAFHKALEVEARAYWHAFSRGVLGATAVQILTHEVALHRDEIAAGDLEPPLERARFPEAFHRRLLRRFGLAKARPSLDRIALAYDLWRGQVVAAAAVVGTLPMDRSDPATEAVRTAFMRYLRLGREHLEDLRTNLPELVGAAEARLAERIALNFERDAIEREAKRGALSSRRAEAARHDVETRMKNLGRERARAHLPETAELCRNAPLFRGLDDDALDELARMTKEHVLPPGEVLFEEGAPGRSMQVIARGAVHVLKKIDGEEVLVDVLGAGDIVGEMSLISGEPRQATVVAATAVTLGEVSRADFDALLEHNPELAAGVARAFVERLFDNYLRAAPAYSHLSHDDRVAWCRAGRVVTLADGDTVEAVARERRLFVATGSVRVRGAEWSAPAVIELDPGDVARAVGPAHAAVLPDAHLDTTPAPAP